MKFLRKGLLPILIFAALTIGIDTERADAQETRKVPAMSLAVHKLVQKAQVALQERDLITAKQVLEQTLSLEKINDYERAVVWQMSALIAFEEKDTPATILAYETILKYSDSIPQALEYQLVYGLAQLYYSEENYQKSQEYLGIWQLSVDVNRIGPAQWQFLTWAAYDNNDHDQVISHLDKFFESLNDEQRSSKAAKNMYLFLASSYWELENFQEALDAIRNLIPDASYTEACALAAGVHAAMEADRQTALIKTQNEHPHCASVGKLTSVTEYLREERKKPSPPLPKTIENQKLSAFPLGKAISAAYPTRASEEGVEGYALLEFSVEGDGSVDPASIIVLQAKPKGYFEKAAIEQAAKFRYRPKIVGTVPQRVDGLKYHFSYKLGKSSKKSSNAPNVATPLVQPLIFVQPVYPWKARKDNIEGHVIVEFTLKKNGKVSKKSIKIIEAEPEGYFEEAAIKAMKAMRYERPKVNGKSRTIKNVRHKFSFNLKKD